LRLKNYINEEEYVTRELLFEKIKYIQKECKYYINLLKKNTIDVPFFRGSSGGWYQEIETRTNRKSHGMSEILYDELNKILKGHGHVPRNQAVITTASPQHSSMFGITFYFFPIGRNKFNYTWTRSIDLNFTDIADDLLNYIRADNMPAKQKNIETYISSYFTTNKNIKKAWINNYETWFDCKKYILLRKKECDLYNLTELDILGR
jgi:hypothetical protein